MLGHLFPKSLAFFLLIFFCACSSEEMTKTRIGDFTIVSSRNVDLSKVPEASQHLKARGVEGLYLTTRSPQLTGLENGISHAIDDAINKASGDYMLNCVIYLVEKGDKIGFMVVGDVIATLEDKYAK